MDNPMQDGAAYIRVSTDRQEELSPDAQKRLLLDYAKAHNIFILPEHIFMENGISGRKAEKRPEFQRMISMAKSPEKPFSVILVWKFSRFARNQEESIVYKSMLKKQHQVDVISITEPLIEGPFGSLIERIIEWMDEYYSINLSGEVMRGMTEKAMRGGYQATPPLGYKSPGHNKPFIVVPEEKEIVRFIFERYTSGQKDPTGIARELNERGIKTKRGKPFEKRTITYILKNRFYIGKVIWNDIERDGQHETFISEELFQAANERLESTYTPKKRRSTSTTAHWLSGLVKCSICGSSLVCNHVVRKYGEYSYFTCWKAARGMHPDLNSVSEKVLVDGVYSYFESLLNGTDFEFTYRSVVQHELPDESTLYRKELEKLDSREKRIHEAYEAGIDTLEEYRQNKERIQNERERLTEIINSMQPKQNRSQDEDREKLLERIHTVYDVIKDDTVSNEVKGIFIRSVLEKIEWNKKENSLSFYLYMPE